MKKAIVFLVVFSMALTLWATPPDSLGMDSIFTIQGKTACVGMDAFKNLFWAKADGTVLQFDSTGRQKQYRFSNNRLGAPDHLDASNPLKTILFYKDYQRITLLDRTLSEAGSLDFTEAGFGWISALCLAQDGSLWVYDQVDFTLKNISQQGNVRYQGQSLNNLLQQPVFFEKIYVEAGRVYAWDVTHVYIFDNFGQYLKHIPLEGVEAIHASKKGFLCYIKGKVVQFDPFFIEVKSWQVKKNIAIPPKPTKDHRTTVFLVQKRLIRKAEKALTVYSW